MHPVLPNGRTVSPPASYLIKPQVTKGLCSWLGSSSVGVPSLRQRSVGPRRTDIHVLAALSRHPCRSTHSASSTFGLHPSRDKCRVCVMCMKIKIRSEARRSKASRLKPVPLKAPCPNCLIVPTLCVGMHPRTLCVHSRLKPVLQKPRTAYQLWDRLQPGSF